jgi:hypothetical protein
MTKQLTRERLFDLVWSPRCPKWRQPLGFRMWDWRSAASERACRSLTGVQFDGTSLSQGCRSGRGRRRPQPRT